MGRALSGGTIVRNCRVPYHGEEVEGSSAGVQLGACSAWVEEELPRAAAARYLAGRARWGFVPMLAGVLATCILCAPMACSMDRLRVKLTSSKKR